MKRAVPRGAALCFVCVVALAGATAAPVAAQQSSSSSKPQKTPLPKAPKAPKPPKPPEKPDNRKWEIEGHLTWSFSDPSSGGKGALPGAGATFQTAGGFESRRESSWYFGDGAALLNNVLQNLGRAERVTALDATLTGASAEQTTGNGFGFRITHKWAKKWTIETAVDVAETTYTINSAARSALKTTADSFVVAFNGLAGSAQGAAFINPQITSTSSTANGDGIEVLATGALVFEMRHGKKLRPYIVAGGGLAVGTGEAVATLQGRYRFGLPSGAQVDESDNVNVKFGGGLGLVVLGGAGVKYRLWQQLGVQADARILGVENHLNTVIDTHPSVTTSTPADALYLNMTPSIQFSTNPSTGHASSLTAAPLSGFATLSGSGFRPRYLISIGGYVRF